MCRLAPLFIFAYLLAARPVVAQQCEWSALGQGVDDYILAMTMFDDGGGPALYVGGAFQAAGGQLAFSVARWDGDSWSALGPGLRSGNVYSFAVFDDGRGEALYAGGSFQTSGGKQCRGLARWDGDSWIEVGGGITGTSPFVRALCVFDDGSGPALYAGGNFSRAGGVEGTSAIARWDGNEWSPVGRGVGIAVRDLTVFDDGSGPALYAAGTFRYAGGAPANYIAKWDGAVWSPLAGGLESWALALGAFDDGSGPALYVGGDFVAADGRPVLHIARWDGATWSEVGGGMDRSPWAFTVFDDGRGPALHVGGGFSLAGDTPASGVARWNGEEWSALGGGLAGMTTPGAYDFANYDDGGGPALYAGGRFLSAGGRPANRIARWRCQTCPADCDGSGDLTFFDFLCFQNLFAAADPQADCDGSGGHDFFDFLCFQNAFVAGCG